jgi:glycosyltransferase involved in cell wall biosynthesis
MNILFCLYYYPVFGGGERVTVTLANEMVKRGHNIYVAYCIDKVVEKMPYNVDSSIKTVKLSDTHNCKKKDINKLRKYIVENNMDVIMNIWGNTKLCHKARTNTKCKLIICHHSAVFIDRMNVGKSWKQRIKKIFAPLFRYREMIKHNINYSVSDKYVLLSSSFVEEYKQFSGNKDNENKLTSIHNPIEYKNINVDFSKKQKKVVFVGRILEEIKRLSYILKIWQIVENSRKYEDWRLTIVGDGEDLPKTKKLSQKLQLKNISFEGFQNPEKFYEKASLFLMTSAFEGLPMTLIEAQSFGCVPIVMDSVSVFHDIIENMQNGILTPNNDLEEFTEGLCLLMDDAELREKMAKNGMESVKKFSVENIVNQWEKLFEDI